MQALHKILNTTEQRPMNNKYMFLSNNLNFALWYNLYAKEKQT